MSRNLLRGAHAPSHVGFGALADTFLHHNNWNSRSKIRNHGTETQEKFALAGAPMPAREARALPKPRDPD